MKAYCVLDLNADGSHCEVEIVGIYYDREKAEESAINYACYWFNDANIEPIDRHVICNYDNTISCICDGDYCIDVVIREVEVT